MCDSVYLVHVGVDGPVIAVYQTRESAEDRANLETRKRGFTCYFYSWPVRK